MRPTPYVCRRCSRGAESPRLVVVTGIRILFLLGTPAGAVNEAKPPADQGLCCSVPCRPALQDSSAHTLRRWQHSMRTRVRVGGALPSWSSTVPRDLASDGLKTDFGHAWHFRRVVCLRDTPRHAVAPNGGRPCPHVGGGEECVHNCSRRGITTRNPRRTRGCACGELLMQNYSRVTPHLVVEAWGGHYM